MANIGPSMPEYDYLPDSPPSIVVSLGQSGLFPVVQLFLDGQEVAMPTSGATELGATGNYAFSLSGMPPMAHTREQWFYLVSASGALEDEGQFILKSVEGPSRMPSLRDSDQYLHQIIP